VDVIHPTNCLIRKGLRKSFRMFINPEEVTRSQMETLTLLRGASHSPVLQKHHVDYYASIRPDSQTTNQVMKLHCVPSYSSESQRTDGARLMKMYKLLCQFWSISDEVNHPRWLSGDVVLWFSHPWCWRRRCVWWAHTAPTSPMQIMQRSWFLAAALVGVRAPGFTQTSGCPTQSKSQGPGTFEADDFWYQFMIIDPGILA